MFDGTNVEFPKALGFSTAGCTCVHVAPGPCTQLGASHMDAAITKKRLSDWGLLNLLGMLRGLNRIG